MMTGETPCHHCEERHAGCHAECERYKAMLEQRQAIKDAIKANGESGRIAREFLSDSVSKTLRKHRLCRRK